MVFRRYALTVVFSVFLTIRILAALAMRTDSILYAALTQWQGKVLSPVVCYPPLTDENRLMLYPTLYAVIPSIMADASQCSDYLTP